MANLEEQQQQQQQQLLQAHLAPPAAAAVAVAATAAVVLVLQAILQCSQSVNPKVCNKLAALHNLKIGLEPRNAKIKFVN